MHARQNYLSTYVDNTLLSVDYDTAAVAVAVAVAANIRMLLELPLGSSCGDQLILQIYSAPLPHEKKNEGVFRNKFLWNHKTSFRNAP